MESIFSLDFIVPLLFALAILAGIASGIRTGHDRTGRHVHSDDSRVRTTRI